MKFFAFKFSVPEAAAGFQQVERAHDVGGDEIARPRDGPIHVRFRREMHDVRNGVFLDHLERCRLVPQVHFLQDVFWMTRDLFQVLQPARVSQAVQVDELRDPRIVNDMMNQVGANEACTAGY